ncbi:MAG: hypothetical protein ACOX87_11500 [Chloroflexota bacterium]
MPPIETPVVNDPKGPAVDTPALFASPDENRQKPGKKNTWQGEESEAAQLPLPLQFEPEANSPPVVKKRRRKKGAGGFVPVTRDPDVAQSYSDNVALDYDVAKGLAQALQSLPPEELAALRAKVAKAAQRTSKQPPARNSG